MVDAAWHDFGYVFVSLRRGQLDGITGRIAESSRFEGNSIKIKGTSVNNLIHAEPRDLWPDGNNSASRRSVAISPGTNVIPEDQRRFGLSAVGFRV